jgi:predicted nucleic acid-binding protein
MVLDASAAVKLLTGEPAALRGRERILADACHAPHLFDAEIGQAIRGRVRAGHLGASEAPRILSQLSALVSHRYPHVGRLAERAWVLRDNVSFYDGLYVALAAELGMPLVTSDARLARAPRLPCEVDLF